jgi:hypothetical protein
MKKILSALAILAVTAILGGLVLQEKSAVARLNSELAEQKAQLETADTAVKNLQTELQRLRQEFSSTESSLSAALSKIQMLERSAAAAAPPISPGGYVSIPSAPAAPAPPSDEPVPKRSWGPEQVTGASDTFSAGDIPTAWASREPNAGAEWLKLEYSNAVEVAEVRVRETYNPGAISRIAAVGANGQETIMWEGTEPASRAPVDMVFTAQSRNIWAKSVVIYLDTTRVASWSEIDSVELIGRNGQRQWAMQASASSTYAER